MGRPVWRQTVPECIPQSAIVKHEKARSPIRRVRRSQRRFHEDVPVFASRVSRQDDSQQGESTSRLPSLLEEIRASSGQPRSRRSAGVSEEAVSTTAVPTTAASARNIDMNMSLLELTRLSTEEQIRILADASTQSSLRERLIPATQLASADRILQSRQQMNASSDADMQTRLSDQEILQRLAEARYALSMSRGNHTGRDMAESQATIPDVQLDSDPTPRPSIISDVRSFLSGTREADSAPSLGVDLPAFHAWAESRRSRRRAVDGLGDRDRSLSPDDSWETLLSSIAPDNRLPSAESSFTSAAASFSARSSALSLAQSASTNATSVSSLHHCEFASDSDASDTEADDDMRPQRDADLRLALSEMGPYTSDAVYAADGMSASLRPSHAQRLSRLMSRGARREQRDMRREREHERAQRRTQLSMPQNPSFHQ